MAIALASLKEGSEESRQKRAVRRYLNKKKQRPIEEGSEESRQRRAKRFADKQKKDKPVDEATIHVGSHHHMMHSLDLHHNQGIESPHYHIHRIGIYEGPAGSGTRTHRYLMVSKHSVQDMNGHKHPTHLFNLWHEAGKTHIVHRQIVE